MRSSLWRTIFVAALVLCSFTSAVSANGPLFAPIDNGSTRAQAALFDTAYRALAQSPAMARFQVVRADVAQVNQRTRMITLNLAPGLVVTAQQADSYRTKDGLIVWYGILLDHGSKGLQFNAINTVTLVRNGDKVTGNVHYNGEWFHVRPLKQGGHALVAVDVSRMPRDDDESLMPLVLPAPKAASAEVATIARTVIRVMVNYTASAAAATGDILGLITLAVSETNQGYNNSGVQIDLQLAGTAQVTYTESGSSNTDVTRYRITNDGYMDSIHTTRNSLTADVGVLLVNSLDACGQAAGIGSTFSTAFAVVKLDCATGANRYSFGHEIGHLQWARHNPENDSTNTPYPFGHGYRRTSSPAFRTIMAYDCSPTSCATRVNYWSSPYRLYGGVAMGTVATHNNARVLNTTKTTVAGFFAPSCIPDGGVDDVLGATSCCSGTAVAGSTYCSNPADWGNSWASCSQICGTPLVNGCVPSGGIDDILYNTACCSGGQVAGSEWCLDQADWGTDWATCVQTCQ